MVGGKSHSKNPLFTLWSIGASSLTDRSRIRHQYHCWVYPYMRAFAQAWPDEQIVQGPLAQITWYHTITLLETGRSLNQLLDEALHLLLQRQSRQQPRRGEEPDRGDV